jgi:hypothetical protein
VWSFREGRGFDTSTYTTLSNFNQATCGLAGYESFTDSDPSGLPAVFYNGSGANLTNTAGSCSSTFSVPNRGFVMHPMQNDVIAEWTSPIDGTVSISGGVSDADVNGGNGINWALGVLQVGSGAQATSLGNGGIPNGGSASFTSSALTNVSVTKGTKLVFDLNAAGDTTYDLTNVRLDITGEAARKPLPGGTILAFKYYGDKNFSQLCTAGFGAHSVSGRDFMLGAKHCTVALPAVTADTAEEIALYSPMTIELWLPTGPGAGTHGPHLAEALYCGSRFATHCVLGQDGGGIGDVFAWEPDSFVPSNRVQVSQTAQSIVLGESPAPTPQGLKNVEICHFGEGLAEHSLPEQCNKGAKIKDGLIHVPMTTCHGDSGGPAYVYSPDKTGVYAVGIVIQNKDQGPKVPCTKEAVIVPIGTALAQLGLALNT